MKFNIYAFQIDKKLLLIKLHFFLAFASSAPIIPFLSTISKQRGYSSVIVGLVFTLLTIPALLVRPVIGAITDKYNCRKIALLIIILTNSVVLCVLILLPGTYVKTEIDDVDVLKSPLFWIFFSTLAVLYSGIMARSGMENTICIAVLGAKMILYKNAEELNELLIRNKDISMLLNEQDRSTLDNLINELSKDINSNLLKTILGLQENKYSIEIIWQLHTKQIVDFTEFIICYKWDFDHIVKTLLCMSESKEKLCQDILIDLLGSLLILLSGEPNHKFDQHIQIIQQFLTQSSLIIIRNHDGWLYLKNLKCSPYLTNSTIQKILKIILKNMLIADVDFHLNIAYEQYRLYKTPDSVYNMLKMFLDEIAEDDIYILIQNVLTQHSEKSNWKLILSLISTFVKTKPDRCHMLKLKLEDFFNQTLSQSITEKSFLIQKAALLTFRHCCLEIGLWSEYNRWYSSYKPNVDTAKVFYSLLTELLPIDVPAALAAHINTQPKLTESCGDVQSVYVKRAQAQLIKINHGEDYMGLFKNYDDCQNRHESDIVKVLESYKSTGQIMRVVLEACVFRNKYFTGTFLKTLMNTQLVDNELRNSFIEKLNSMNKIPKNMYTKWKQEQKSVYFS